MKLNELLESVAIPKELFHATTASFSKFKPRPTWFSTHEDIARGWHEAGTNSNETKTLVCKYTGGKIASEKEIEKLAKEIWPDAEFLYSMFDENVGEFEKDDIRAFIKLLQDKGFDAAFHEDYDPRDFNSGHTTSFVVFRPDRDIKIIKEHTFKSKELDFKVGDKVEFFDESSSKIVGTIVNIVTSPSEKVSAYSSYDGLFKYSADKKHSEIEYYKTLYVVNGKLENGHDEPRNIWCIKPKHL